MHRFAIGLSLLLLTCALAAVLGLRAGPLAAQGPAGASAPGHQTTRYLLTIVRTVEETDAAGALTLSEAGAGAKVAVAPLSGAAAAAGYLGAVEFPNRILEALGGRGATEVIFRGETEASYRSKVTLVTGKRFPVVSTDVRGDQIIKTTKFEKVGAKLDLTRRDSDVHDLVIEVSAVSGRSRGSQPIIYEVTTRGNVLLPDGCTAVFSFFDRTEGEDLIAAPSPNAAGKPPADLLTRFVVLLTRLDLMRK